MIGFKGIDIAKAGFFRPEVIQRSKDRALMSRLSRFGAFVRQRARHSIRKRKAISAPGSPPSSHVGTLRDLILFAFDAIRRSVVIGPVLFRAGSEAANLLEEGDTATRKGKTLTYRARPYMGPAFREELAKLPPSWRDSIK